MKNLYCFILLLIFIQIPAEAQSITLINTVALEKETLWHESETWGTNWSTPIYNVPSAGYNNRVFVIKHRVIATQALSFRNQGGLTVEEGDTLVIKAGLYSENGFDISVKAGGVLIVIGNLDSKNNIEVDNDGYVVVTGDVIVGSNPAFDGNNYYVYNDPNNSISQAQSEAALRNNPTTFPLWDYVRKQGYISTLPIELLYFKANSTPSGIHVEWASAKEWNFSHYALEKSTDGRHWKAIHQIGGDGVSNSVKLYEYQDEHSYSGVNYYRLKAIDVDGVEVIKGITLASGTHTSQILVSPNPADGGLVRVQYSGAEEDTWISVSTLSGREIYKEKMQQREANISIINFMSGLYIIEISNFYENKQCKLVVQ